MILDKQQQQQQQWRWRLPFPFPLNLHSIQQTKKNLPNIKPTFDQQQQQQQQETVADDEVTEEEDATDDTVDVIFGIDDDDDDEGEEDEDHIKSSEAEGVEERQELEQATVADADADGVMNDTVLAPSSSSSSSVAEVWTTPLPQEQEEKEVDEVEAAVDDYFLPIQSVYHPQYWKIEQTLVTEEAAEEVLQQIEGEVIIIEAVADHTIMTQVMIDPSSASAVEVLSTPFVKEQEEKEEEEEKEDESRIVLCVAMFLIVGIIAIHIYCHSKLDDLFMDQDQQGLRQEQEDGSRIVQVVPSATDVIPKQNNVVLVVAKWVRTILTNKKTETN